MKKLRQNQKKKKKFTKIKKVKKELSNSQDSNNYNKPLEESNSPQKYLTKQDEETDQWIETLIEETKNYDLEIDTSKESSSSSSIKSNTSTNEKENEQNKDNNINLIESKDDKTGSTLKNKNKIEQICNNDGEIIDIKIGLKDCILYNGKEYKKYQKVNKYNNKRKIKKIIYKCKNYRKDEKLRIETNQKPFCEATLEYI